MKLVEKGLWLLILLLELWLESFNLIICICMLMGWL